MQDSTSIEKARRIEELRLTVYALDESMTLDHVEAGYVFGAKQAAIQADWHSTMCHLVNLEAHIKAKLDQAHRVLTDVRREARRKK